MSTSAGENVNPTLGPPSAQFITRRVLALPVASLLCPPHLRPAVGAIYWFARTADDIADEGSATPAQRLAELADYRRDLDAAAAGTAFSPRMTDSVLWPV